MASPGCLFPGREHGWQHLRQLRQGQPRALRQVRQEVGTPSITRRSHCPPQNRAGRATSPPPTSPLISLVWSQKIAGLSWALSPSLPGGCGTVCHLPAQPEGKNKESICRRGHLGSVSSPVFPVRPVILLPVPSSTSLSISLPTTSALHDLSKPFLSLSHDCKFRGRRASRERTLGQQGQGSQSPAPHAFISAVPCS